LFKQSVSGNEDFDVLGINSPEAGCTKGRSHAGRLVPPCPAQRAVASYLEALAIIQQQQQVRAAGTGTGIAQPWAPVIMPDAGVRDGAGPKL
jgi:hypothetical protein